MPKSDCESAWQKIARLQSKFFTVERHAKENYDEERWSQTTHSTPHA
jgi:hypothetical protein